MTRDELVTDLKTRFGGNIIDFMDKSPTRIYLDIDPPHLPDVASYIFRELGARFHIASGVDGRTHLEVLYHFSIEDLSLLISLRVKLDRSSPSVPSIAGIIKGANWIEREIHELLGIDFEGHPDLRRLLLSDEWPEGVYPLRQDYQEWDSQAVRDRGV